MVSESNLEMGDVDLPKDIFFFREKAKSLLEMSFRPYHDFNIFTLKRKMHTHQNW